MKFVVGIMLTSFGTLWAPRRRVSWPGHDAALLVLVPVVALVSLGYTVLLRQRRGPAWPRRSHSSEEVALELAQFGQRFLVRASWWATTGASRPSWWSPSR